MKKHYLLPLLLSNVLAIATPAFASTASQAFKDVPQGHWAEKGIEELSIKRGVMHGFSDLTFRGAQPFTRLQFALLISELIREVEKMTGTSLALNGSTQAMYQDISVSPEREIVLKLANRYHLYEGISGIHPTAFRGDQAITRYEVARTFNNLLRLAEQKDVVHPKKGIEQRHFIDIAASDPNASVVDSISNRYGIMIGFPDSSFRGADQLTRYEFAATAWNTVPMILELVRETMYQKAHPTNADEFSCDPDLELELRGGPTSGSGELVPSLSVRWQGPWALVSDGRLQFQSGTATQISAQGAVSQGGVAIDERLGFMIPGLRFSPLNIQPMLGVQLFADFGDNNAFYTGPTYGLRGTTQITSRWKVVCDLMGSNLVLGQSLSGVGAVTPPEAEFFGRCDLGVQYALTRDLALVGGIGYWEVPVGMHGYATVGKSNVAEVKFGAAYAF